MDHAPSQDDASSPLRSKLQKQLPTALAAMGLGKYGDVDRVWSKAKPFLKAYLEKGSSSLYASQNFVSNFVQLAVEQGRSDWLRDLMEVYLVAADHLQVVDSYEYFTDAYGPAKYVSLALSRPMKMWVHPSDGSPREVILYSSQFLYPISLLAEAAATHPALRNDPIAELFHSTYLPVLIDDHLLRWVLNRDAPMGAFTPMRWFCSSGNFSHREFIAHLTQRNFATNALPKPNPNPYPSGKPYCNTVTDSDLFIAAATIHVLRIQEERPELIAQYSSVTANEITTLREYAGEAVNLFRVRTSYGTAQTTSGAAVETAVWDRGGFDGHPDLNYAGDSGTAFPGIPQNGTVPNRPAKPKTGLSWDISHGRRLVRFLFSLERNNDSLALLPAIELLRLEKGYASQLAHVVFDGDFTNPNFATFLDGTVGWYRVNYSGRLGFGYGPNDWTMGRSFLTGGYAFWTTQVPMLARLARAAYLKEKVESSYSPSQEALGLPLFDELQILSALPLENFGR